VKRSALAALAAAVRRRPGVLVLVDLVQDIDVLLPVILALRASGACGVRIAVSRWLERESPRTAILLRRHGLRFSWVRRSRVIEGLAPSLAGVSAVLAAAESSRPAHAAGRVLAQRANAAGLKTYALQHGLENVGLFGLEAASADFASQAVFCWFPSSATPAELAPETAAKLIHVGRPAPPGGWTPGGRPMFDLGVFENLHWDRYSDAQREAFVQGLTAVAERLPGRKILVRPHPAGAWAERLRHKLAHFANITLASAAEVRRSPEGPAEALGRISRVITTPSTIALDAALAGRPVALAVAGGPPYRPLPVLESPTDWIAFAEELTPSVSGLDQFLAGVLVAGDGAPRIAERILGNFVTPPAHVA
jgi:hypothetical protein